MQNTLEFLKQKKNVTVAVVASAAVAALLYFILTPGKSSCKYSEKMVYSDGSMGPTFQEPMKIRVYPNAFNCEPPKHGDLTVEYIGDPAQPYVRVVAAVAGDVIRLREDPEKRGYNLVVNDEVYTALGKPYYFGIYKVLPVLALYLDKTGSRTLAGNQAILFSVVNPGYNDSGLFGLYDYPALHGKVVLPGEKQKSYLESVSWVALDENELNEPPPKFSPLPKTVTPRQSETNPKAKKKKHK